MKELENPFRTGGIARGYRFADRETEVERIGRSLRESGGKLLVYGPRRMGKTSAIVRSMEQVQENNMGKTVEILQSLAEPLEHLDGPRNAGAACRLDRHAAGFGERRVDHADGLELCLHRPLKQARQVWTS